MPSYDWRNYQERRWTQRFPDWSQGSVMWQAQDNVELMATDLSDETVRVRARPPSISWLREIEHALDAQARA